MKYCLNPIIVDGVFIGCAEAKVSLPGFKAPNKRQFEHISDVIEKITFDPNNLKLVNNALEDQDHYYDYGSKDVAFENLTLVPPSEVYKLQRLKIFDVEFLKEIFINLVGEDAYKVIQDILKDYFIDPDSDAGALIKVWVSNTFGSEIIFHFNSTRFGRFGEYIGLSFEEYFKRATDPDDINEALDEQIEFIKLKYKEFNLVELLNQTYAINQFWFSFKYKDEVYLNAYLSVDPEYEGTSHITTNCTQIYSLDPTRIVRPDKIILATKIFKDFIFISEEFVEYLHSIKNENKYGITGCIAIHSENFAIYDSYHAQKIKLPIEATFESLFSYVSFDFLHPSFKEHLKGADEFDPQPLPVFDIIKLDISNVLVARVAADRLSVQLRNFAKRFHIKNYLISQSVEPQLADKLVESQINFTKPPSIYYIQDFFDIDFDTAQLIMNAMGTANEILPDMSGKTDADSVKPLDPLTLRTKIKDNPFCNAFVLDEKIIDPSENYQPYLKYKELRSLAVQIANDDLVKLADALAIYTFQKFFIDPRLVSISKDDLSNMTNTLFKVSDLDALVFGSNFVILPGTNLKDFKLIKELSPESFKSYTIYNFNVSEDFNLSPLNNLIDQIESVRSNLKIIAESLEISKKIEAYYADTSTLLKPDYIEIQDRQITLSEAEIKLDQAIELNRYYLISAKSAKLRYEYLTNLLNFLMPLTKLDKITLQNILDLKKFSIKGTKLSLGFPFNFDLDLDKFYYRDQDLIDTEMVEFLTLNNILKSKTVIPPKPFQLDGVIPLTTWLTTVLVESPQDASIIKDLTRAINDWYTLTNIEYCHDIFSLHSNTVQVIDLIRTKLKRNKAEANFSELPYTSLEVLTTLNLVSQITRDFSNKNTKPYKIFNGSDYLTSNNNISYSKIIRALNDLATTLYQFEINQPDDIFSIYMLGMYNLLKTSLGDSKIKDNLSLNNFYYSRGFYARNI